MTTDPAARAAKAIARIASQYPVHKPRDSLEAVERLRQALGPGPSMPIAGVVGTNGKSGTATYLARLLTASGLRTGLYVSPHLNDWTERIRVDDLPCDAGQLLEALTAVDRLAKSTVSDSRELRFFDLLTLAAEQIIGRAAASIAVFEAGIGGRLDAVHALEPFLLLLTSVGLDHAEILGEELSDVLREKLLAAPAGATILSFPLGRELDGLAEEIAGDAGCEIAWIDPGAAERLDANAGLPTYLRRARLLAVEGWRRVIDRHGAHGPGGGQRSETPPAAPPAIDLRLSGRFERGERGGVPYILDAAHNDEAWRALAAELERQSVAHPGHGPLVAVVSLSPAKRRSGLAGMLRSLDGLEQAIVTRHTPLPSADPAIVADELRAAGAMQAVAIEDVATALELAFEQALRPGGGVLVFGSTHLVGDTKRWLAHGLPTTGGPQE